MAIRPIYTYEASVLRSKTIPISKPSNEVTRLALDMFETMKAAQGIGLAANQIGEKYSLFVIDLSALEDYEDLKPLVMINPVITEYWGDDIGYEEGCLSLPNVREEIIRPEWIHVRYRDLNFQEMELEADNLLSRVVQHEFDHLQGVFFTDYLKGLKKRLLQPSLDKIKRGEVEADYPLMTMEGISI